MCSERVTAPSSFAENVDHLLAKLHCRAIETEDDLDLVLRLRYAAYLKEGAIRPNESCRLIDRFDALENAVNIGVFHEDSLVAAMRIHFLSQPDDVSPSLVAFPEVLMPHLEAGKRMVDPNRFIVDYETARKFPHLAYVTMRLSVVASAYFDAHFSIASIRVEHQAFYKRLSSRRRRRLRLPIPVSQKPCLMLVDYENNRHRIVERSPFYASSVTEQERLFGAIREKNSDQAAAAA